MNFTKLLFLFLALCSHTASRSASVGASSSSSPQQSVPSAFLSVLLLPNDNVPNSLVLEVNNEVIGNINAEYAHLASWLIKFILKQRQSTEESYANMTASPVADSDIDEVVKTGKELLDIGVSAIPNPLLKEGAQTLLNQVPWLIKLLTRKKKRSLWRKVERAGQEESTEITGHDNYQYLDERGKKVHVKERHDFGFGIAIRDKSHHVHLYTNEKKWKGILKDPEKNKSLEVEEIVTSLSGWILTRGQRRICLFNAAEIINNKKSSNGKVLVNTDNEINLKIHDIDGCSNRVAILYKNGTIDLYSLSSDNKLVVSGRETSGKEKRNLQRIIDFCFFKCDGLNRIIVVNDIGTCCMLDENGDLVKLSAKAFAPAPTLKITHVVVPQFTELIFLGYENGSTGIYDKEGNRLGIVKKDNETSLSDALGKLSLENNPTSGTFDDEVCAISRM